MRLTTKGRYAVTAALDLAIHYNDGPVNLAAISERQFISLSYLEQLFAKLRRADIVKSVRGPGGGYILSQSPSDITIRQIIEAVDDSINANRCRGHRNCRNGNMCLAHCLWSNLSDHIRSFLGDITLTNVIEDGLRIAEEEQENQTAPTKVHHMPSSSAIAKTAA